MVHPVKTPLGAARAVTHAWLNAVRHPIRTAGDVATLGRGLVAFAAGHRPGPATRVAESERGGAEPAPDAQAQTLKKQGDPLAGPATETQLEPEPSHEQVFTEPSAVTGPGDEEEISSPAMRAAEEDVEVTTPVGTTGAGPDVNPDTTESDLQQPGTEPLMDPSTTKRIKRESEMLRKASDLRKD